MLTQTHTDSKGNTINLNYDSATDAVTVNFSAIDANFYIVEIENGDVIIQAPVTDDVLATWSDSDGREAVNTFFLANKISK
jgi:hypothetical protein